MIRTMRLLGVIAGMLGAAGMAAAGPIEWSYRVTTAGATGAAQLYLGEYDFIHPVDGPKTVYGYTHIPDGSSSIPEHNKRGSANGLWLTNLNHSAYSYSLTPRDIQTDEAFKLRLEVTDVESGETGTADFMGNPFLSVPDLPHTTNATLHLRLTGYAEFLLGRNRYQVELHDQEFYREWYGYSVVTGDVTVTTTTPEPGTLLMAGLGLASGGGLWLRRRR